MWPMYVDFSDEECREVLRELEVIAYSAIVSAFRAQGGLSREKRKLLQDVANALSISVERHRTEIRRVVNDEHLNTIAERLSGPNTVSEWTVDGRRGILPIHRIPTQTIYSDDSDLAANTQATKNMLLPMPVTNYSRENKEFQTMPKRKHKDISPDPFETPAKVLAFGNQYLNKFFPPENPPSCNPESPLVIDVPMMEKISLPDATLKVSAIEHSPEKITVTSSSSIPQSILSSKHLVLKSPPTTTFSCLEKSPSDSIQHSVIPTITLDDSSPTSTDMKSSCDSTDTTHSDAKKTPLLTHTPSVSVKPCVTSTSTSSSGSTVSSRENLPTSTSSQNPLLTQLRSKPQTQIQHTSPSLGLKLNSQTSINQRIMTPKSSGVKVRHEVNATAFFAKKTPTIFAAPDVTITTVSSDLPMPSASKSNSKPESLNSQIPKNSKQGILTTGIIKSSTTTQAPSQFVTRSLFPSSTKNTTKNLSPVIFNVSSNASSKTTTGSISQHDVTKTASQLLPKSSTVGLTHGHLKITSSNTQAIQYRNDGGMMKNARIVNISQPVGTRLPCSISSALGLSSNIPSTALRVTLPAGSLNSGSSMRVASAAKPNVIVVHKAQMWPRAPQGAAVIMSSSAKMAHEQEMLSLSQKNEKNSAKFSPRPVAPANVPALSGTNKPTEQNSGSTSSSTQKNTSTELKPSMSINSTNEAQCKKNLLADVIEASGILLENSNCSDKSLHKNKDSIVKNDKSVVNHQESDSKIPHKNSLLTSKELSSVSSSSESNKQVETVGNSMTVAEKHLEGKKDLQNLDPIEAKLQTSYNEVVSSNNLHGKSQSNSDISFKNQILMSKDKIL